MLKLNWTGVEENRATYATIPIPHAQFAFIKENLAGGLKPSHGFSSRRNNHF